MEAGMNCRSSIRLIYSIAVALCFLFECSATAIADEKSSVDVFKFDMDENAIFVPIELYGQTYLFLVDTGCSITLFDFKLLHNEPKKLTKMKTPGGTISISKYDVPAATVRSDKLQDELSCVGGHDFSELRKISGQDFYGMLGMDFLKTRIVEIDFDKQELLLHKGNFKADPSAESLPISYNDRGLPTVGGQIADPLFMSFVIDTGCASEDSGGIGKVMADYLLGREDLNVVGNTYHQYLGSTQSKRLVQSHSLTLGKHRVFNPIFSEGSDADNRLSLYCLSRFHVTMDFPNNRLCLRKGEDFDKPDLTNLSGLHILRTENQIVVHSVDDGSVAHKAGIQAGDVILKVDGEDIESKRIQSLRRRFYQRGKVVKLALQRGEQQMEVTIELKDPAK
jgi:hypothetical protein